MQKLIAQLCPEGVAWKAIESICIKISSGGTPNTARSDYYDGDIPWLRTQEVDWRDIKDTDIKITEIGFKNSSTNWIPKNCVIVAMYGATAAKVAINKIPLTTNQACCNLQVDESKAMYRYVYYWLTHKYLELKELGQGSQTNINAKIIRSFKIPLPPLPIQQEIVRILDTFTALIEALTAELTARKKQYAYYRDKLLTFGDEVEWKTLGEIATDMYRGSGIKREELTEEGTPCVRYGEIYTTYHIWFDTCVSRTKSGSKSFEHGDVLFAITGESVEEIAKSCVYTGNEKCFAGGDIVVMKHNQNPKYISYALSTTAAKMQKSKGKVKSKVVHSSIPALKEISIPLPPLAEQQRIVAILDRFDTLVNDLTNGLPAEIAARRKQYAYYRDKLLTFPEACV